ncbi:hypothetical protein WMY93_009255 [Mugilogobius chulae]|uniref:Enoyl reductase (ER) domain-containing protein n=1 Tax=Mugilogobius chulae TaxID=88201 RepID=A0AAW0PB26_9GOBI
MSTEGKVITCKAAVAWQHGKPLTIEEVQVDPPQAHEVRIKMLWSGVCHTDWAYLYEMGQDESSRSFPMVLGHEGAGEVESVGSEVTNVAPGDKVIPLFLPQCGECERCRSPRTNQCRKNWEYSQQGMMADGTSRITYQKQQVYQFLGACTLTQYTVVADCSVAKIQSDAPLDRVCLLGCGVSTGYGAAINAAQVEEGSTCAVFGLGAVGLAAVMGCRAAGAANIIGIDINPKKFPKALEIGATECINPQKHYPQTIQQVLKKSNGGVDYALVCVGDTTVMSDALESTVDAWGVCVVAGWTDTDSIRVNVDQLLVGRTLKGTYFGVVTITKCCVSCLCCRVEGAKDLPLLVDKYMKRELELDTFITHRLNLEQVNEALDLLRTGEEEPHSLTTNRSDQWLSDTTFA